MRFLAIETTTVADRHKVWYNFIQQGYGRCIFFQALLGDGLSKERRDFSKIGHFVKAICKARAHDWIGSIPSQRLDGQEILGHS